MLLSSSERDALGRVFALLAEGLGEREVRLNLGHALLDLLRADHFASYVWDAATDRFDRGVSLNLDPANLARYEAWYQYRDPITFRLQQRRHATRVAEVMPYRELRRHEFYGDFLARDGMTWGINLHAFDGGGQALGDLRIWRGRGRDDFGDHDKGLLDLIEPAFISALRRAAPPPGTVPGAAPALPAGLADASPREREVAQAVAEGLTDKQIARRLGISPTSVRTYLRRLADKAGVQRRGGVAALAAAFAPVRR